MQGSSEEAVRKELAQKAGWGLGDKQGSVLGSVLWDTLLEAPLFTPTEHAISVAFGQLLNSTGKTGSFVH